MTRRVIDDQEFDTFDELSGIVSYWLKLVELGELPHAADTIYAQNVGRMTLVEDTLTDGSLVVNFFIFPSSKAKAIA